MPVEKCPSWLQTHFDADAVDLYATVHAEKDLVWIGYSVGDSHITIDGEVTLSELRELADMVETNAR